MSSVPNVKAAASVGTGGSDFETPGFTSSLVRLTIVTIFVKEKINGRCFGVYSPWLIAWFWVLLGGLDCP